ncbi:MAG: hypothetical protein R6U63_01360 [Longimicrobiales bacterium]
MTDTDNDPLLDRAITILRDSPSVALPLPELARRVGTGDPDGLARLLAADDRVRVLGAPALPGLTLLPADRAAAYEHALTAAGLRPFRRVALLHPTPVPGGGVAALLRQTTARLLAPGPDPARSPVSGQAADAVAEAAEQANRAVLATRLPGAAAPSTTRPPGPPPPHPGPPLPRPPGSRRPPRP